MKITLKTAAFAMLFAALNGCALAPPATREYELLVDSPDGRITDEGFGRVIFINDAPFIAKGDMPVRPIDHMMQDFSKSSGLGKMNVLIDGKPFAQINTREYAQVLLPYGTYKVTLVRQDMVRITSEHLIAVFRPQHRVVIYGSIPKNILEQVISSIPLTNYTLVK